MYVILIYIVIKIIFIFVFVFIFIFVFYILYYVKMVSLKIKLFLFGLLVLFLILGCNMYKIEKFMSNDADIFYKSEIRLRDFQDILSLNESQIKKLKK
jgi:hypothetical protein